MAIADGVDDVRAAVREEMRQGADAIKIMVSGGVASPYDPLEFAAILARRDRGRRRGGARLRPLCARPCLYARSHHARGEPGRAHHRARQSHRRASRQADGQEQGLHGRQSRRLCGDEGARRPIRHERRHARQERHGARGRAALARALQEGGRQGRLRHRPAGPAAERADRRVHAARGGDVADRDHPFGDHRSAPRSCAWKASSASSSRAPSPI